MAQTQEEVLQEKRNWHWRNSMRPVRFFGMDARAGIPWFILLFYFRPVSLVLTLLITAVFSFLEKKGLSFSAALRAFRAWLLGQRRPGYFAFRKRKMIDYG
ncbi:MAG: type IV secretion protein IcmT [Alphaproteobacteria bacterium]|nr:type IV secretion protein IcmT [Alphaproteobacteria bacterium]